MPLITVFFSQIDVFRQPESVKFSYSNFCFWQLTILISLINIHILEVVNFFDHFTL